MAGNSPVPYRKVERAFNRGGATLRDDNGSHVIWTYKDLHVCIVKHKNHVDQVYIKKARKVWKLTKLKDKDFWDGNWGGE